MTNDPIPIKKQTVFPIYDIAFYLKSKHFGKENVAQSRKMELLFGLKGSLLRYLINTLRSDGIPICSNSRGYYYAETKREILETIQTLDGRTRKMQKAKKGLQLSISLLEEERQLALKGS